MLKMLRLFFLTPILFLLFFPLQILKTVSCVFDFQKNKDFDWQWSQNLYAETLTTVEEALKIIMPEADSFVEEIHVLNEQQFKDVQEKAGLELNPDFDQVFRFFRGEKNGQTIGYAIRDTAPGKWGVINFMVGLSPKGDVSQVLVLEYQEKRGKPVAHNRFLKQFKGKTAKDDIRIMRDIKGVSGASISSNGMTNGVRKLVHIFDEIYGMKK